MRGERTPCVSAVTFMPTCPQALPLATLRHAMPCNLTQLSSTPKLCHAHISHVMHSPPLARMHGRGPSLCLS